VIEDQITNPFIEHIVSKMARTREDLQENFPEEREETLDFSWEDDMMEEMTEGRVSISNELVQELSLAINYDCWVGHANFNITPEIRAKLKVTPGVEALKIISRYRFFIGVGKMFDFAEVRKFIENQHCNKIKEGKNEERNIE
jgi:hypothetical protein